MSLAMKETKGNFPLDPLSDDFQSLDGEINILKQVKHKNIVRLVK
jgi:hypothetical protein